MVPMKLLAMSRMVPRRPMMSGGGLEREIATSEHKYMETKIKTRGKGDLQLRYDLVKLLNEIPMMIESSERGI